MEEKGLERSGRKEMNRAERKMTREKSDEKRESQARIDKGNDQFYVHCMQKKEKKFVIHFTDH